MSYLTPSTWRYLGLSVGLSYVGLGTYYSFRPDKAAEFFGLTPKRTNTSTSADKSLISLVEAAEKAHDDANRHWMYLLGARDVAMGVAIYQFYRLDNANGMATVILSGMVICAVDVFEIWRLKGPKEGLALGIGATIWGVIGLGLL